MGRVFQLEQTEEGRDALYKESAVHITEPDFGKVRSLSGYKTEARDRE